MVNLKFLVLTLSVAKAAEEQAKKNRLDRRRKHAAASVKVRVYMGIGGLTGQVETPSVNDRE